MLAAFLMFLVNDNASFRSAVSYEIKAQNNSVRQKIRDSLTYTKQIMAYVGKQISIHDPHDYKYINELLINYRVPHDGLLYWNVFAWVNENNKVKVASGMGFIREDIDLSDRQYLLLAKENPETTHVGNPLISKLNNTYLIPISYGIINSHREYMGSIVAGLVINNLESQVHNIISDENILFAIIDGSGSVVAKSLKLDEGQNKKILDKILENIKNNPGQELLSGLAYYQRLIECEAECANYGVITIYDNNTITHRNRTRLMIYLLIASFAVSISGFMLFGFYEHVIHPIAILSEAAQKIHNNEPNIHIPKFEVNELNQLANSLEELDKALWKNKK